MYRISSREPESGRITWSGWISPDGVPYPVDSSWDYPHAAWIEKYSEWLDKKGYYVDLESFSGDQLRDELINYGWVHLYDTENWNVYDLNQSEDIIINAILAKQVLITSEEISIYEMRRDERNIYNIKNLKQNGLK